MAIKLRRGTNASRFSVVFEQGEIVYTTDTKKVYIGDGVTAGGFLVGPGGVGGGVIWGAITGTLSDQVDLQTALDAKQVTLVSGTNIKTINGVSILGSGNITIASGGGTWGSITGTLSSQTDLQTALNGKQATISLSTTGNSGAATFASNVLNIPNYTLAGLMGISLTSLSALTPLSYNNTTGQFSIQVATTSQNGYLSSTDWTTFNGKQDTLVSGTNIKTINGSSILGSGNLVITGGVGSLDAVTTVGNTTTNAIFVGRLAVNTSSLVVFPTTFNVGINTAVDAGFKLDVVGGDSRINGLTVGRGNGNIDTNIVLAKNSFISNVSGTYNVAIGVDALNNSTTATNQIAIGYQALQQSNNNGNIGIGRNSFYISSGDYNIGIGDQTGSNNTTGFDNIFIGRLAGFSIQSVNGNIAIGRSAMVGTGSGTFQGVHCIAIGVESLLTTQNPVGRIIALGYQSMGGIGNISERNIGIGYQSGLAISSGSGSVFVGDLSGQAITTGANNIYIGSATTGTTNSSSNVLLGAVSTLLGSQGVQIGQNTTNTASSNANNVIIGYNARITGASNIANVVIGHQALSNFIGCVVIGKSAAATANNQFVIGSTTQAAGSITTATAPVIAEYWTVIINGVSKKIALIS
jgi:hypothetical protein